MGSLLVMTDILEAFAELPREYIYRIRTAVQKLERNKDSHGELVWFVQFEGSSESISLGNDCPDWIVGDKVEIILQRFFG
jgi:hypothetical protein